MYQKKVTCNVCSREWKADDFGKYEQCEVCRKYFCKPQCGFQNKETDNWVCDKCSSRRNQ